MIEPEEMHLAVVAARAVEVAQQERRSIAADLHDGPVQQLIAASLRLQRLQSRSEPSALADVDAALGSVQSAIESLRSLIFDLDPPLLASGGLIDALQDLADSVPESDQLRVVVRGSVTSALSRSVRTAAYRMVREGLTNARKHADARLCVIELTDASGALEVTIADDGQGFVNLPERRNDHFGLAFIASRAELLGGSFTVQSQPGSGTVLRLHLPLQ